MSLAADIASAYVRPLGSFDRKLDQRPGEENLLSYGMLACLFGFVARLPAIVRDTAPPDAPPLYAVAAGHFVASLFMAPLLLYALAALSHLLARAFGGRANWREARLALFWAALASAPLVLALGLVEVLADGRIAGACFLGVGAVFLCYWGACLYRVEFDAAS